MLIRGLSYQNGVFFIGSKHISCGYHHKGRLKTWIKPINASGMLAMLKQVIFSMPVWFKTLITVILGVVFIPKIYPIFGWSGLPIYTLFYVMFGTHFIFPKKLRQYHGAEHKVFSDRGVKKRGRLYAIRKAAITNRNCSTNFVVIYFLSVILGTSILLVLQFSILDALAIASYGAVVMVPIVQTFIKVKGFGWLKATVLSISYWLQTNVTTTEPGRMHLLAAIESYRTLALTEFPEQLIIKKKEVKKMAIVDVTIIPIGTETSSVSSHVAEIHRVLKSYEGKVKYQLTPMSTIIEGELSVLFEVIQAIHEVPFQHGVKRVATNIRIDDRRDKQTTMEGKLEAVRQQVDEEKDNVVADKHIQ